jgi:hypothetical protein
VQLGQFLLELLFFRAGRNLSRLAHHFHLSSFRPIWKRGGESRGIAPIPVLIIQRCQWQPVRRSRTGLIGRTPATADAKLLRTEAAQPTVTKTTAARRAERVSFSDQNNYLVVEMPGGSGAHPGFGSENHC